MEEQTNFLNEMTKLLMKTWTEIDTQALKNWFDLVGLMVDNSILDNKSELELITQSFLDYQQLQFRLLKLSFDLWQDILSKLELGEDQEQILSNYSEKLRNEVNEFFTEKLKNSQDTAKLWQIYLKEMGKFNQILSGKGINTTGNPWIDLNNIYWNFVYEQTFGSLMRLPVLEPGSDLKSKLMKSFDAWMQLYPASINYQIVLSQIQIQSFESLIPELILLASKGEKVKDWLNFQQLWGRTTDKIFEKTFCLEDNVKIRGRFLNAINNYKLSQQDLIEVWMKMMNMPIRSEVDEVHKSIYELRKEVKSLKKTLAKFEEAQVTSIEQKANQQ